MAKPLKPSEVKKQIPDFIIEAVNEFIQDRIGTDGTVTIPQGELMNRILAKNPSVKRSEIFDRGWLDIENLYRGAGWYVDYEKPAYNETGSAYFTFSTRRPRR